ncbi:hypothetical protein LCGC14_1751800 [marine sediment metagenome]|uniref:Protein translocase subunit SecY n=1 Tax=marine sediment metagenome TaxID=412755 RepID=A0A0F9K315_9ZZZZ
MTLRAVRLILGIVLVVVAALACVKAVGLMVAAEENPHAWVLSVGMVLAALAGLATYYYALFKVPADPFKAFRGVLTLVVGILAFYLIASGAADAIQALGKGEGFQVADLMGPLAKVVVAAGAVFVFYYATIAASGVRRVVENIFSIPELLKKLGFTLGLLCIYRIGFHIPLPGLNQDVIASFMQQQQKGAFGQVLEYVALFTGGNLQQSTLFGLGIMPYISASIIFQLLVAVVPALERLQKEGQAGHRKIQEYTRYAAVGLCVVQASFWMRFMQSQHLLYPEYEGSIKIILMGICGLTAGTMFLMWLGEQIDEYGIGNGISLIIMAGIVSRLPVRIQQLIANASLKVTSVESDRIGLIKILFLVAAFVFVVAGSILICQAQRRIPIQQAKHTRGRRVYGGQRQYLPLRVNHSGVMPIIFASSLLIFPSSLLGWVATKWPNIFTQQLAKAFSFGDLIHSLAYVGLIFFFSFFWTTVQFRPKDMSDQLRDYGSFIPGLRPGKRTADYLERVMERITYCGAAFLAVIAVIPQAAAKALNIPFGIASFLGGTALLIMVAVALDLVQRIESNLIMRSYGGFLGEGGGRIKGSRE